MIDLDALELEYKPRRHNIGDDRIVALITELRATRRVAMAAVRLFGAVRPGEPLTKHKISDLPGVTEYRNAMAAYEDLLK